MTAALGEILLVDDTQENLRVLGDLLRTHGLTVRVAASGAMALRSVQARRPDLILLDIRMPEMDGFEVCRRLRELPGMAGLPVLFLSASDSAADRLQAFRSGGEDFISKPFESEEVLARVTTHLNLARVRRELDLANDRLAEQVMTEGHLRGEAEAAVVDGEMRLELTLDAASMGTWEVDRERGDVLFSRRAQEMLGLPADHHLTWREFLRLIPDADQQDITARWERSRRARAVYEVEGWWTLPPPDDRAEAPRRRRIRLRGRPLPSPDRAPGQMVGVIWDITEEHLLRERLVQSERLEALGLLAGGVAHDFNNQLAIILAEVEVLDLAKEISVSARPHIDNITHAAEASAELVRDLLAYARRRDVQRIPLDLGEVVRQATRLAARSLGKGIRLDTHLPEAPAIVLGNNGQLQNAILNLCINARDAMPDGGQLEVRIETRAVEPSACLICATTFAGTHTVLSVRDTGCGIPETIRGRIFEPFFTTKSEGKGTGLGLAAVLGCVAAHDGHLTLESAPDRGTTFRIHLPPCATPIAPLPTAAVSTRSGRVLLLDDQDTVRTAVADGLRRLGWTVVAHEDPEAAIAAWQQSVPRFDVALVDMVMPRMNGAKVFRALRRGDPTARVLLMSGHSGGEDLAALHAEGLAGFVDKPVKLRHLAGLLSTLLAPGAP